VHDWWISDARTVACGVGKERPVTETSVRTGGRSQVIAFAGLVVVGLVVAMVFGPDGPLGGFWRPLPGPEPEGAMVAGFIGVGIAEGLGLGAALAILLIGRAWFARLVPNAGLATAAWLSSVFLLASWWPHSAAHRHFGDELAQLLWMEWVFHVGAIVSIGVLLGALLWSTARPVGVRA